MLSEAQSFWDAISGKIKQLIRAETQSTMRCERYEVTTAPDGAKIGVTKPFGTHELMLPYSAEVATASVGDPVLVVWWHSMSNAKVYYFANGFAGSSGGGGGGGTSDYTDLTNKPSINGVTLSGNKTAAQLSLGTYTKPVSGIPASDLASGVIPEAYTSNPAALGTASPGSSTKWARGDHVHEKPTYSKSDVGLGNVDNVQQYSANNPPPYPVTSVNGSTGAVTLSIPATAGDVGAIPAPSSPTSGDVLTYSGSAWAASAPHYVPAGGNSGALLAKSSATDYQLYWRTISDYTAAGIIVTAAATAAKICQYSFWDDTHYPQILYITLASANTATSALTLKVNGKGPYPIYINGTASSATNYTLPAGAYVVYFDGTNFYFDTTGKIPSAALPVYNGGVS